MESFGILISGACEITVASAFTSFLISPGVSIITGG